MAQTSHILTGGLYDTRGVDFDDLEFGFKEEDKDSLKVVLLCPSFTSSC